MEFTYHLFLTLVFVSDSFCSQSKFTLPSWDIGSFQAKECEEGFWKCPGEKKCVKLSKLCDGENDCLDGLDEVSELCTEQFCSDELNKWKCPGESKVKFVYQGSLNNHRFKNTTFHSSQNCNK